MHRALDIPADLQLFGRSSRVIAVIRPFRVDDVMARLVSLGPQEVAVELVRGYGRQKDHLALYDEHDIDSLFLPKVRIEFIIAGERLRQAIDAVCEGALTGRIGDGKIFIQAIEPAEGQLPVSAVNS
ncbi:MAG: nitrogen regulatory protein PII [Pseudohongiellaceae bacterium]|jgi:nitrogen regulatory protein PII